MILGTLSTTLNLQTLRAKTAIIDRYIQGRDPFSSASSTGTLVLRCYFSTIALFFLHHESVQIYVYMRTQVGS